MMPTEVIHVHIHRLPDGHFAFVGSADGGRYVTGMYLRRLLFAWYHKSFYGTVLDIVEVEIAAGTIEGIRLSPYMTLNYLAEPAPMLHGNISWSSELGQLSEAAKLFMKALGAGWYMPSYKAWLSGKMGWKPSLPDDEIEKHRWLQEAGEQELANLEDWFSDCLGEMLQEPELDAVWGTVLRENVILQPVGEGAAESGNRSWLEEEEWLVAIGWMQDDVPFQTCIQLVEPDQLYGWNLRIILQDKSNANLLIEVNEAGEPVIGRLPSHWLEHVERKLNKDMAKCFSLIPELEHKHQPGALVGELNDDEAWTFMDVGSLMLIQAGISVMLPSWWERLRLLKPQLKAKIHSSVGSNIGVPMFGMDQLVKFNWRVAVGSVQLTEAEFRQIVEEKKRLVNIRGNWVQLDPALLEQIMAAMKQVEKNKGLSLREVMEMHLLEEERLMAGEVEQGLTEEEREAEERHNIRIQVELNTHLKQMMMKLDQTKSIERVEAPEGLNADLRPYQLEGVSWLLYLRQFGLGGCLADDMGLGKTIQFIAYLLHTKQEWRQGMERDGTDATLELGAEHPIRRHTRPSLLICPTSVIGNWQKELDRFAPSLKVHLHYGAQRVKGDDFIASLEGVDLVITSYNLSHVDEEDLTAVHWDAVCLDEAQNIKNAYTKQASAIRGLQARQRIALTGTPIENRLTELWSIFEFINPGYLSSLKKFTERYVKAIEKEGDKERTEQIQALIKPFILRRVKKDPSIQLDLPDKNEAKAYVSLTLEQSSLYENVVQRMLEKVETLAGMEKKGLILATLTKLKQICNHPAIYLKEPGPVGGGVPIEERSQKLTRLLEMIKELRAEGERCLIFTQFVEMGHLLQATIERERQEPVQFLHGGLPKGKRDQMIARFQDEPSAAGETPCGIFILSLKAGGTGLNLTGANHVFHYDRWWNPAVENQATDRAFRVGQTRNVQVHKFITIGTLEERIDEMIERKQGLSEQIVGSGEGWVTEMSTGELRELFALRKRWAER